MILGRGDNISIAFLQAYSLDLLIACSSDNRAIKTPVPQLDILLNFILSATKKCSKHDKADPQ